MGKQHELLAVEGDLSDTAAKIMKETLTTFTKKPDHFMAMVKKVTMLDDERSGENQLDVKELVTSVEDKLAYLASVVAPYFDAVLQKEATNQAAIADLMVGGDTIATGLPATFLLGMETKLKNLRAVYEAIPTLQPGVRWVFDSGVGAYVQDIPSVNMKTEKRVKPVVLYDATPEHPAQVKEVTEDVNVGRIETTLSSGMITPRHKSDLLANIDRLLRAVKKARQRANTTEVVERAIGEDMFRMIHANVFD